ncbi:MAG: tRNA-dihydrouridine synthase [Clostridiales bacterium]|jgi:nifR3 family TIM-barrel protein|nr:tRNA-dihydrouridine synthase [Clostridiales bacterium]
MTRPLVIADLTLKNDLILAPMAGYGDPPFRRLCAEWGAGLTVTEMISVKGLVYKGEKTRRMLAVSEAERPYAAVQLFGRDPAAFARALTETDALAAFSLIDINMGCPVPKITKQGEGSALLKEPALAAEIVRAVKRHAGGRPVGVKMRLGYCKDQNIAVDFAKAMEQAGADLVTVHGRTAHQGYAGLADWDGIAAVKAAVSVPVAGSGDVSLANYRARRTLVDGLMLGRGALGRPWLFAVMLGSHTPRRLPDVLATHIGYMREYAGSAYAAVNFRKHLSHYLHTLPGAKEIKQKAFTIGDAQALTEYLVGCAPLQNVYTSDKPELLDIR